MARPKQEQETLVNVSKLEKLAASYDKTGKTLKRLARTLRNMLAQAQTLPLTAAAPAKRKGARKATPATPKKRKLSAAARKKISDAAKARWAAKKQEAA